MSVVLCLDGDGEVEEAIAFTGRAARDVEGGVANIDDAGTGHFGARREIRLTEHRDALLASLSRQEHISLADRSGC